MKFSLMHKKPSRSHKRMLLTDPNSLIGYRIDQGHIKLMSVLGVGGNGVVYHAVECIPTPDDSDNVLQPTSPATSSSAPAPREFAVKALSKVGLDARQLRLLAREFDLHTRVSDHAHIVTFHGIVEEDDFYFAVMDYVRGGDIFDMIELHRTFLGNDELIRDVFLQLVDAVEYCHVLGVSHRDIKPENILCKDGGSHVLLADFGLSTDRVVVKDYGFGSEPYMAPQCFGGFWKKLGPYSAPHADIWSLGVVLVNLVCARNPWHKATEESAIYKNFLSNPNHLREILPVSYELNEILKRMFAINPQARISLKELRVEIKAVRRFALTEEELKWASPTIKDAVREVRRPALTPGAPHTAVARQITNLTAEDIDRLESEARAEAKETAVREELEARQSACVPDDEDEDEDERPLFLSPTFSPSTTIVGQDSTPRPRHTVSFDPNVTIVGDSDSDFDSDFDSDSDSDSDSDGPITPESRPAADIDIAGVPEISLDGDIPRTVSESEPKRLQDRVPQVSQNAVRKVWWL